MSYIGYCATKTKVLLLVVSIWSMTALAEELDLPVSLTQEVEQLQKGPDGDQKAIDLLWSNSGKLNRSEFIILCKLLVKKRNFKDILKVSELALAKHPKDAEFLTFQGKAYMETGRDKKTLDKVQESLRAAIEANPKFEPAYLILDDHYERQDGIVKNQKKTYRFLQTRRLLYEDLIQNIGEKHLYVSKICEINTLDGFNEGALKSCKRAMQLKRDDWKSRVNLATVYKQTGENKLAESTLKKAAADNPQSKDVMTANGSYYEDAKNYSEAYNYYKKCLTISAEDEDCIRGVGATSASLKKWPESLESFQKLCKKNRKWSLDVRKASATAKDLGALDWEQKFIDLSLNCNI